MNLCDPETISYQSSQKNMVKNIILFRIKVGNKFLFERYTVHAPLLNERNITWTQRGFSHQSVYSQGNKILYRVINF